MARTPARATAAGRCSCPTAPDWIQVGVVSWGVGCARRRLPRRLHRARRLHGLRQPLPRPGHGARSGDRALPRPAGVGQLVPDQLAAAGLRRRHRHHPASASPCPSSAGPTASLGNQTSSACGTCPAAPPRRGPGRQRRRHQHVGRSTSTSDHVWRLSRARRHRASTRESGPGEGRLPGPVLQEAVDPDRGVVGGEEARKSSCSRARPSARLRSRPSSMARLASAWATTAPRASSAALARTWADSLVGGHDLVDQADGQGLRRRRPGGR